MHSLLLIDTALTTDCTSHTNALETTTASLHNSPSTQWHYRSGFGGSFIKYFFAASFSKA